MRNTEDPISILEAELDEVGLSVMATSLHEIYHSQRFIEMDRAELLSSIIEPQYQAYITRTENNRLKRAHLLGCPFDLSDCKDGKNREYLPQGIISALSTLNFIRDGLNVCILGASDTGKTFLAKAIGIAACREYRVAYHHSESLIEEMAALKRTDYKKYRTKLKHYANLDLLILDDFLLHGITEEREVKVLQELLETRIELSKSVIICSQRDPDSWEAMIMNDTVASNAILKRATKHYTVMIKTSSEN